MQRHWFKSFRGQTSCCPWTFDPKLQISSKVQAWFPEFFIGGSHWDLESHLWRKIKLEAKAHLGKTGCSGQSWRHDGAKSVGPWSWAGFDCEREGRLEPPSRHLGNRQVAGGRLGTRPAKAPGVGRREISEKAGRLPRIFVFLRGVHKIQGSDWIFWRKKWQPTAVFLPGKSHGQRSLAGYSRP